MKKYPSVKISGQKLDFPTKSEIESGIALEQQRELAIRDKEAERYRYIRMVYCECIKKDEAYYDKLIDEEMELYYTKKNAGQGNGME